MSTSTARVMPSGYTRPVPPSRPAAPAPPRLRVVAPTRHRSATGLALLSITLLVGGLLALLMLNISIGKGAYELSGLQKQQRELAVQQQELAEQVEQAGAPQQLAKEASKLGMVPAPNTVFVKLPDGTLQGTPATATAPPKPEPEKSADAGSGR